MLRLDPGEGRVSTTRSFRVWEGGGEYNVARALRRCFGLKTAIVTALADNPVGRLVEDLMLQGGVDLRYLKWVEYDGVGRETRNGLNFTERGFGIRGGAGCSDRGHTAVSQLVPGQIDWDAIMRETRWFHTGGIFAALSDTTPLVAKEAMEAAQRHGVTVSYDLNYRPSLWKFLGGPKAAGKVNAELMPYVNVLFAGEDDMATLLGLDRFEGVDAIEQAYHAYPRLMTIAHTQRTVTSSSRNDWGAVLFGQGKRFEAPIRQDLEILDRVGGGDGFASGLIYGMLMDKGPQWAVECGAAHGALAMTTPGDTSMSTLEEVLKAMEMGSAGVDR
ncbi:sugar kinase [bacterium]|nr:MAG: sugar kinase [bacterium]